MDPNLDHHEYCTRNFNPDDIVISGMAGRFPECDSVGELKEALFQKKNLIIFSDRRYEKGTLGLPFSSSATLKDLSKFDAEFFNCVPTLANQLDPAARIHMEVTYEAIADAGVDPMDLKGQKIGIFNATISSDIDQMGTADEEYLNLNSVRTMNPNKTSYTLGFTGPSLVVDTACSSSGTAYWAAVQSLQAGCVEAAVVSGCQLNLAPELDLKHLKMGVMSPTGNSRPYDIKADGLMRGEAVCAIFLQKAKVARRAYATIKASRFYSAGHVSEGISVPSKTMQTKIMKDILNDAEIHPDEIQFMEGHGTGTQVGDPIEVNAMTEVFSTETRKTPLLLGSIKGNIGHTQASAGLCGVIKSLLAFETGLIIPNINYEAPNPGSPALLEGKVSIVTESTPLIADCIPVTCLGFGGTVSAIVLKKNPENFSKTKRASSKMPRIVLYPATTQEAVMTVFDYISNNPDLPEEFFALLSKLSFADPSSKPFRGYAIYKQGKSAVTSIKPASSEKRQIWYILTGMGCQWPGMGLKLMEIDVFASSMKISAGILKFCGVDLFEILRADKNYFLENKKITSSFVTISAIQIALVDVLKLLDIAPDGIIGYSFGEIVAAYADGACTHEQALMATYMRGVAFESANLPEAGMAAIGVSWSQAQKMCPKDIYLACDNSEDSVTVSGLKEPLKKFVEKTQHEGIFARMINSHGYGSHSQLVNDIAPGMKEDLEKIFSDPKSRTEHWISTSYAESEWNCKDCKVCGPEYFSKNLVSSVLFKHALKKIPSNSIVIEIAPHNLLKSILRLVVGPKASYHNFMLRKKHDSHDDSLLIFMESLGSLYQEGLNPKIERLFPAVKFPVPRGTPMISDLIKWNHSQSFKVPKYIPRISEFSREFTFDKENAYLLDFKVGGRSLFPAAGFIIMVWDALAKKHQKYFQEMPVVIEKFQIHRQTIINAQSSVKFLFSIQDFSGHFEIMEGKSLVASGKIYEPKNTIFLGCPPEHTNSATCLSKSDINDELNCSGNEYGEAFRNIAEYSIKGTSGLIQWQDRWTTFLEGHLLFNTLTVNKGGTVVPVAIQLIKIDPNVVRAHIQANTSKNSKQSTTTCNFPCSYNPETKVCRSIGVIVSRLKIEPACLRGEEANPILEEYKFVPYESNHTPSNHSNLQLSQYLLACKELAKDIKIAVKNYAKESQSQIKMKPNFHPDEFKSSENKILLRILEKIASDTETFKNNRNEYLSAYTSMSGKDILNNVLVNEDSLRIMLEIIGENSNRKLNITEVSHNFPIVLVHATKIARKYKILRINKSVLFTTNSIEIEEKIICDEQNIQQLPYDCLKVFGSEKSQHLAIGSFTCGPLSELEKLLCTLNSIIKPNGFILLFFKEKLNASEQLMSSLCGDKLQVQSVTELEKVLHTQKLIILSKTSDPYEGSLYLLRAPSIEEPQSFLQITSRNYDWVEEVKNELYRKNSGILWLIAEDGPANGILGLVNCLKHEPEGKRIRCIFSSNKKGETSFPPFNKDHPVFHSLIEKNLVINVWKNGTWGSYRYILMKETKSPILMEHSFLDLKEYGDLSSFEWVESSVKYVSRKNRKLAYICYSAVNSKDVMLASGKLSRGGATLNEAVGKSVLGLEFSGREEGSGRRICGLLPAGAMATSTLVDPNYCLEIPPNWSMEEAATIPLAYATAYYALIIRAKLQPAERILIHSGSDGIWIAAITVALSLNCEVFTTVGNDETRAYLERKFPQIKKENIGCSCDVSFETMIYSETKGGGVDVILNSFVDERYQANFRCISNRGRIVHIEENDSDFLSYSKLFPKNASLHAVSLEELFHMDPTSRCIVTDIMNKVRNGIKTGIVQPLERTVFDIGRIADAFGYMERGVHDGKVLLKIQDEETQKGAIFKPIRLPTKPCTHFYCNKVYIIIGGLGGFGLEVAKWMVDRGARNIILTSRYGARNAYHHLCLKRFQDGGLNVQVSTLNVAKRNEAEQLLKEAMRIGPLGGIFNSSTVYVEGLLKTITPDDYKIQCASKSEASEILDELTRKMCPKIDYFVCFSSIAAGRGYAGQAHYGFANSAMERICEERRKDGLHGLSIQWGIIGDVGLARKLRIDKSTMITGVEAQSIIGCLRTLDIFCQQDSPVVTSYMVEELSEISLKSNAFQLILKILGIKESVVMNMTRKLREFGIDSLVGSEIKEIIKYFADVDATMQDIFSMNFNDLKSLLEKTDETVTEKVLVPER